MATIGGRQVRDVAAERKANLKATGGLPAKRQDSVLSSDAKNLKIKKKYEDELSEVMTPRKRK